MSWSTTDLVTDADLTAQESRMPAQAKRSLSDEGATAYDGKRALVKRDIASWLQRRGMRLTGITDPTQFNRAATLLELSYIYRDMAQRNDTVSSQKADAYYELYSQEIEGLRFDYAAPAETDTTVRPLALLWRG
jgi:hypothetical protein